MAREFSLGVVVLSSLKEEGGVCGERERGGVGEQKTMTGGHDTRKRKKKTSLVSSCDNPAETASLKKGKHGASSSFSSRLEGGHDMDPTTGKMSAACLNCFNTHYGCDRDLPCGR